MPGLHVIQNNEQSFQPKAIGRALEALLFLEDYQQQTIFEGEDTQVHFTAYPNYPLQEIDAERYRLILEGSIFNQTKEQYSKALFKIAPLLFEKATTSLSKLAEWALTIDGDFIAWIFDKKTNDWLFFNDTLGRLPLYYFHDENTHIISREIRLLLSLTSSKADHPMAIAESLLFGYSLEKKTIYKHISKASPASLFRCSNQQIQCLNYYQWDFSKYDYSHSPESIAAQLASQFTQATYNRLKAGKNPVISLSGGLDSRALVGALERLKQACPAVTFAYPPSNTAADIAVAQTIAKHYELDWRLIDLAIPTGKEVMELISLKGGMNYMGMAHILPVLKQLRTKYDHYLTGDGGDKVLPDLYPLRRIFSLSDLVQYLLQKQAVLPLAQVSQLTGIAVARLKHHLAEVLSQFPEKKMADKLVHFLIMGRSVNWLYEGEDRNRYFVPSSSPFFALPFYQLALQAPNPFKQNYDLYRLFLAQLSPSLNQINNANWQFPLSDQIALKRLLNRQRLGSWLPQSLKNGMKRAPSINVLQQKTYPLFLEILQQANLCPNNTFPIDTSVLLKLPQLSRFDCQNIITILATAQTTLLRPFEQQKFP